ncbi:hypothetical protein KR059_003036, partial [Drosophila kikkawai]
PTSTKHPLWRAHPNLSSPADPLTPIRKSSGCWARSDKDRAETFASHLQGVFQPNPAANPFELPQIHTETESTPASFRPNEITKVIRELKPKKAPGDDLITQKMIIELPNCAIEVICKIFNGIISLGHYPTKWKISIIIMIPKPGKDHTIPALGPTLFLLYTADIPTSDQLTLSTFADDTAILSRSRCPVRATAQLANHLKVVEKWLSDWRIKINEQKCKHITFT